MNFDPGLQRDQDRRQVCLIGRVTMVRALDRVTHLSTRLEAKGAGLPPELRLIVEETAGIQAQVAAQSGHVPQWGSSDATRCLGQDGESLPHQWGFCEGSQPGERTDLQYLLALLDEIQPQSFEVQQVLGSE